ncbi:MAG: response regulator [Oscillospiraceae bacterium]
MYELLLVDDEEIALSGLSLYVDWQSMGFHLAGAAQNIAKANEILENEHIDVILTDIQLENESGLDLISTVVQKYPKIRCVILSGHEEFEYVRQALRYGTYDFLTKPVQFDALQRTFQGLAAQLRADRNIEVKSEEYFELKRSAFFNNLARDKSLTPDPSMIRELFIKSSSAMVLVRVRLVKQDVLPEGAKKVLRSELRQKIGKDVQYELFDNALSELALLLYDVPQDKIHSAFDLLTAQCSVAVQIGVSDTFSSLSQLRKAYYQAGRALDYQLLWQKQSVMRFEEIKDSLYTESVLSAAFEADCKECLVEKDLDHLLKAVNAEIDILNKSNDCVHLLHSFAVELFLLINKFLNNYLSGYSDNETIHSIRQIVLRNQREDIASYVRSYLVSIWALVKEANPYSCDVIQDVQHYLQEHYMEDITLQKLSDLFFLHPTYLSRLFKEKSGENFIDYLTGIRFEKAKRLLCTTTLKVSDIGQAVGYESPKYFSKIFKELSRITPKDYREANAIS